MPIDSNLNESSTAPSTVSAIENEIPAYRAISPGAVVALILGVLSVLCFASWSFLILAASSVVLGFLSDRKIQRFPDVLTGRGMAQAGVGLGLIFGLTSVTVSTVQGVLRVNQAKAFALTYEKVLTKGTFAEAVWYSEHPTRRDGVTPENMLKEMTKPGPALQSFEESHVTLRALKTALAEPGADLHFVRVENHGEQELTQFAGVVYELHTPDAKNPADRERFALVVVKGDKSPKRGMEWWASEMVFPYKDKSFVAPTPAKKADDGHGHSH